MTKVTYKLPSILLVAEVEPPLSKKERAKPGGDKIFTFLLGLNLATFPPFSFWGGTVDLKLKIKT